jgi:hypothetical protein
MPSVPDGTICVSSSDDWLLLGLFHIRKKVYCIDSYLLHNGFSNTSIPLPELDFLVRKDKRIRMFRIRSTADDLVIAAITTSLTHPLVVIRLGKGTTRGRSALRRVRHGFDDAAVESFEHDVAAAVVEQGNTTRVATQDEAD